MQKGVWGVFLAIFKKWTRIFALEGQIVLSSLQMLTVRGMENSWEGRSKMEAKSDRVFHTISNPRNYILGKEDLINRTSINRALSKDWACLLIAKKPCLKA